MTDKASQELQTSFLGRGWSFPPKFDREHGEVVMTEENSDIEASLGILFGTALGERIFRPEYGLDMHDLVFDPISTTMRTLLKDRIKVAILIYEPRIHLLSLEIESLDPSAGQLRIFVDYEVRATNSRYNLVFPFYTSDSNEVKATVGPPQPDRVGISRRRAAEIEANSRV